MAGHSASTTDGACQAGRALAERILPEGDQSFHSLSLRLFSPMEGTRALSPQSFPLINMLSFYLSLRLRTLRTLGLNVECSSFKTRLCRSGVSCTAILSSSTLLLPLQSLMTSGDFSRCSWDNMSVTPSCVAGFEDVFRATLEFGLKHPPAKESAQELWRAGAQNKHCLVKFHLIFLAAIRRRARLAGPYPAMRELAGPTGRYSSKIFRKYATNLPHRSLAMYSD